VARATTLPLFEVVWAQHQLGVGVDLGSTTPAKFLVSPRLPTDPVKSMHTHGHLGTAWEHAWELPQHAGSPPQNVLVQPPHQKPSRSMWCFHASIIHAWAKSTNQEPDLEMVVSRPSRVNGDANQLHAAPTTQACHSTCHSTLPVIIYPCRCSFPLCFIYQNLFLFTRHPKGQHTSGEAPQGSPQRHTTGRHHRRGGPGLLLQD